MSYGSAGPGSLTHLTMELFKQETGAFMLHIPYRGIAPAFTDLLGGQTQAMFPGLAAALPHMRSGRVRPLAVTGTQRNPLLKDVPTMDEVGFKGFDAMQWYGAVGPAGLAAGSCAAQRDPGRGAEGAGPREKLSVEAVEPRPMSPEQFGQYIRADIEKSLDHRSPRPAVDTPRRVGSRRERALASCRSATMTGLPCQDPAMSRLPHLALVAACTLIAGCYVAPYPYYPATTSQVVVSAPSFDKSWDAALGAAADVGVQITSADRANGRITGTKAGAAVTIDVRPQADKTLQVIFNAPDSKETNPTLNARWLAVYNQRMGR